MAPKTEAGFANTWRFLRESPDWPEPEVLRRQAEERIGPETSPSRSLPLLHGLPAAHQHRPHAPHGGGPGREPQRPQEVRERQLAQRHLPQRRRERVPEPLRPSAERRGPDRPLRPPDARRQGAGRARASGQAAARLPAARQCAPGDGDARRRRGDRAARRGAGQARRARDPARARAVDAPHRQPRRCASAARQAGRQPERCVVDRAQPGRARSSGGRPRRRRLCDRRTARPDPRRLLRRGRVPGRLDRAAPPQEDGRGAKAFPDAARRRDDGHLQEPRRLLAGPHARGRRSRQGSQRLVRPRLVVRPDVLRPARRAQAAAARRHACRAIPSPPTPTASRWAAASW